MEDEARKLEKNDTLNQEEKRVLVKDKYYILFKPILYILNKVEAITKTPQSPMEIWFHGKYGKFIEDMMVSLIFAFRDMFSLSYIGNSSINVVSFVSKRGHSITTWTRF